MDKPAARHRLLVAALPRVVFEGWSMAMLSNAASDAGITAGDLPRLIDSPTDMIALWTETIDHDMAEFARQQDFAHLKIRERIFALVMFRLNHMHPHREAARRAMHTMLLPWNAPRQLQLLHHTVDRMWHLAGDTANDYNWYSKRLLLAAVYSSTFMRWLNDDSENLEDTQSFLKRRIEEVLKIGGGISKFLGKQKRAA